MSFWEALQVNPLLLTALFAGLAAAVVSGIMGSYVVVKRITFITGGISHAVLGGMGIAVWLARTQGWEELAPLWGALVTAIAAALAIGWIHLHYKEREDTVIAAIWSIGMAVGVLFIAQTPGFNVELTNFLVGNILWVSPTDLGILFALDGVILGTVFCLHKRFLALCFDEDQARLQGVPVQGLYLLLLVLAAVSVVLLVQVVGVILVMTMLTIPAALANLWTHRLSRMMLLAVGLSALFTVVGMMVAYYCDWPVGATIALVAGLAYAAGYLLTK